MQNPSLTQRCAVITGAGHGLGRALARALAQSGAKVAVLGRTLASLEETAEGFDCIYPFQVDINDSDTVNNAFSEAAEKLGGIDILVNNAAHVEPFEIADATDQQIKDTINTNIVGLLYCVRAAIPFMQKAKASDIINISSESVVHPYPFLTAYAGAKSAVESMSAALREELAEDNIRTSVLRIGHLQADRERPTRITDPDKLERFKAKVAASGYHSNVSAWSNVEDVAAAAINILSMPRDANIHLMDLRSV